ncbi:NAD(P)-binding protein [Mollisia scopiformis]|uniref:NAD(P)-binding protein n=1 Tax=Mollisia scopiformis TaxID=149040 RepID=A0A194X6W9_MOLSC|nr:NAD(P)-binding protein [Mollisia scopiformis]KUJ15921.1 NAD(P)-binding protein [Mollisia scopiformis]
MSEELVLITGISGLVGHAVSREALSSGYKVRAVIRKKENIEKVEQAFASNPELLSKIDFVVIPDLTVPNAFHNYMIGVDHIIHVASVVPHPSDNHERDYYRPPIDMTLNILKAARDNPNVKRVVITSTIGVYIPIMDYLSGNLPNVFRSDDETCHYDMKTTFPHDLLAYAASKAMQLDAAQDFLDKEKPKFETVFIMPSMIVGNDHGATKPEDYINNTTNKCIIGLLVEGGAENAALGSSVGLSDVAKLHVGGLKSSVPPGRYIAASEGEKGMEWTDAFAIVKKHFPEESEKVFKTQGEAAQSVKIKLDASKTEKAYGFKFQSYEDQVKEVVSAYLALLKMDGK